MDDGKDFDQGRHLNCFPLDVARRTCLDKSVSCSRHSEFEA